MPTTFTTAQYDAQLETRANPARLAPANISSGDVEYAVIPYVLTAGTDEAANDLINLCLLPAGVIPIPQLSSITCDADPGTAFTVDIGTSANSSATADPDAWGDGVALTTAGKVEFCAAAHTQPVYLVPTPLPADTGSGNALIQALVITSTSPTAGVILTFTLAYKRGK